MDSKLPKVFANKIDRAFDNAQEYFYGNKNFNNGNRGTGENIEYKINSIFASSDFVYKKRVLIDTFDGTLEKVIVGKTKDSLLTIDNEAINIYTIKDIRPL